jgi:deoxyribonuclease-4
MKTGLKLWSINTDFYYGEAKRLFNEGWFDYIELYVVPDTLDTLPIWKTLCNYGIPFTLHAPHFIHGVNLADKSKENFNFKIFGQVKEFFTELNADYIIVHSGMDGHINETVRQLKNITVKDAMLTTHYLIENKPYFVYFDKTNSLKNCVGSTIEEIVFAIECTGFGFCLDIGHAICASNSLKLKPYEYLAEFNKLNPVCYHLSDNFIDSKTDEHMHLGQGNYDFKKIFAIIDTGKNIAIETNKHSRENLNDFIEDMTWLKNLN